MNAEERLTRQASEDIVLIGDLLERFMNSPAGKYFRIMVSNLQKLEIQHSKSSVLSAERALGRIEAYDNVLNDIEGFIHQKNELQKPIMTGEPETELVTEQTTVIRGGEI